MPVRIDKPGQHQTIAGIDPLGVGLNLLINSNNTTVLDEYVGRSRGPRFGVEYEAIMDERSKSHVRKHSQKLFRKLYVKTSSLRSVQKATGDHVDAMLEGWRRELPDTAVVQVELTKRINVLSGLIDRAVAPELSALGLTYGEFEVLAGLRRIGKPYRLKPGELARALLFTTGGISNVLQRLESAGLVVRESDPDDARGRQVGLTAAGVRMAERAVRAAAAAQSEILDRVPQATLRTAADALREVLIVADRRRH